jgi:lipoyl(octanoyl) transferase
MRGRPVAPASRACHTGDMTRELWCVRTGQIPYDEARAVQRRLEAARHAADVPDLLLLLEHPPVYTKGRRSTADELPMGEDWYRMQGIEVTGTDRGGRVTYHGPGQLVGYPIVSLRALANRATPGRGAEDVARIDVVEYIRRMERVMIASLSDHLVETGLIDGLTGVWTKGPRPGENPGGAEARKIGSIGVHVNRGITTHGFAINVNNDLQPFEWIVPCGIEACRVTSLTRELGAPQDMAAFMDTVCGRFGEIYARRTVPVEAAELASRVDGVEALVAAGPAAAHAGGNGVGAGVR